MILLMPYRHHVNAIITPGGGNPYLVIERRWIAVVLADVSGRTVLSETVQIRAAQREIVSLIIRECNDMSIQASKGAQAHVRNVVLVAFCPVEGKPWCTLEFQSK